MRGWVGEWMSEWVIGWLSEWVSGRIKHNPNPDSSLSRPVTLILTLSQFFTLTLSMLSLVTHAAGVVP